MNGSQLEKQGSTFENEVLREVQILNYLSNHNNAQKYFPVSRTYLNIYQICFIFLETDYLYMEYMFLLIGFAYFLENTIAPKCEMGSQFKR